MNILDLLINFLHVIIGIIVLGLSFGSCFYLTRARISKNRSAYRSSLKSALVLEQFIFLPLLLITFITGSLLVKVYAFNIYTPWIASAYLLLSLAIFCRLMIFFILNQHYSAIEDQKKYRFIKIYYFLQVLFWLLLGLIIVDSITRPNSYVWLLKA